MRTSSEQQRAFSVHLLTASGAFLAFMAMIAAAEERWVAMFLWLGFALFIDSIDGPLARRYDIKRVLPNWSGDNLDAIIDYATYVLIPAFALYQSGIIGRPASFLAAAVIVVTSAIYYADTRMKTADNFFKGFPVTWNMVVFTLFAIQPPGWVALAVVIFCAVTTFLPIQFLHPVRVVRWRVFSLAVVAVWTVFGLVALFQAFDTGPLVRVVIVVTSLYLLTAGAVLQFIAPAAAHEEGGTP